jgi:thiol-disulfide isomerase/thioredoxin
MIEATVEVMSEEAAKSPAWVGVELVNITTGETFKLSDFSGKVVLVENLAMWCSNCQKQQKQVKILHETLGMDSDLISIGFDVDPNEKAEDLKKYVDNNGFDWIYAIPPQEVLQEIGNLYGANFLNPPNTPIFIIDRNGEVHPMPFGIKSADELKAFIDPFLAEGM